MKASFVSGFVMVLLSSAGVCTAAPAMVEGSQVHPAYHGPVPAQSDVIFSTRFKRPEAPALIKAFGSTRVEWGYSFEPAFVASVLAVAPWYGGSINSNGPLPSDAGWARDFDGNVLINPIMRAWGGRLVTTTHPETQQVIAQQVQRFIDLGAKSIQVDDPMMQVSSTLYFGGDFNPSTLAGFNEYLSTYPDKAALRTLGLADLKGTYRDYLKATHSVVDAKDYLARFRKFPSTPVWLGYMRSTVETFYTGQRKKLQEGRSSPIPLSMNLSVLYEPSESNPYFFVAPFADYSMAETHIDKRHQMMSQAATARALGMGFVPSIRPLSTAENRVGVATLYALGGQVIVPWDVYAGNDDKGMAKRYFGTTEEFGDLYGFVRAHRGLFDGHETAAVVGVLVAVDKTPVPAIQALVRTLVDRQIPFAFVPVGGTRREYKADAKLLSHLSMLVSPGTEADFKPADLKVFTDSGVPRMAAALLTDSVLSGLQPFIASPGPATLRLYPRSVPGKTDSLVVHMVDETLGAQVPADSSCRRRVGLRNNMLGTGKVLSAQWVRGSTVTDIKPEPAAREVFFSIPDCPLWGVLSLKLQR